MSDIIAITICVNYSDILKHVICQNIKFFRLWYIVTDENDTETIELINNFKLNTPEKCNNISILIYKNFYDKVKFNKGGAIKFAQEYTHQHHENSNVLLIDSDIYLPDNFLDKIPNKIELRTLYGVSERLDYWSKEDYFNDVNPHIYPYGNKFVGFFQLYNNNLFNTYQDSKNCSECDMKFIRLFRKKVNLDLSVKHLGKEGVNWNGRDYSYGKF